ncbi:hypothetical protein L7F22_049898 [Adiantum nelumboides]|nr:hypothetical protein [Adiantum nelumboides]
MEVMGIRLRPVNKEQASQVEEEVKEQPQEHNEEMIEGMLSKNLTQEERMECKQMLQKFPNLFVKDYINVRGVDIVQHQIELKPESQPRAQKLQRLGVVKEEALLKEVIKLLLAGFIYPVDNSEWVFPVVVTPKKNEEDQKKTTFITPWGCYAFWVMPFGLTNALATFQRFMNHVFQAFFGKSIRVYIDDFCIHSSKALHVQKVEEGLQRLNGFGGQLNPNQDRAHVVIAAIALKDPQYAGMESLTPVVNYILEGEFPKEFTTGQRRKLIKQASTFLWLEGSLYQKGKDLVCRRVPSTNEISKILKGLHEEACGGHFSHELTLKKVLLAGYVWPSTHADVQHWCRSCHNCQVNGNKKLLYGPRQAVIANGPFEKWGIDAMGPLPRTANGKLYILVAIDYMTRWVEAQSVAKVNEKTVSKFVYTHICCRFGTPLEIVSDNGPGFRRGLLTEVCEELKISHRHSTPYYPQSNGLVEKANGIIAGIIRKMVESKPKRWDNFLDGAIWAYRTTYRDATQFISFHLVYGQEALQPIELNIPTIKLTGRQEQSNDEAWSDRLLNLVELEWKREAAYHCYKKKALQLKDKLNEGIKDKEIKEKSLVLRYNNALDNRFDAKFERRWEGPFIVKKAFTGGYYQLMDLNGKEHPRKVNGYRLKPYLSRILPAVFGTKQVSKKTKKVCCHCCSGTHQVKSCAFQHVLHEVAKDQKENLSSPTSCLESSFQYNPVDGT